MNKKIIALLLGVVVLLAGLYFFNMYRNSFQEVTITINNDTTTQVGLYHAVTVEDHLQKTGVELQSIQSGETFKLKKGVYVLVPSGEHLDTTDINLSVAEKPVTMTLDIPYSDKYLTELGTSETPAIQAALISKYPDLTRNYTINQGALYHRGEWYGTTLSNKQGTLVNRYGDTLRVLLQKKDGAWVVISDPPSIILSAPTYPNAPVSVLRSINKL